MIVVNAVIESTEENIAGMKTAIAVMEEKSRAESGCIDYTFAVELNRPSVLRITEKWVDQAALQAHFGEPIWPISRRRWPLIHPNRSQLRFMKH